MLVNYILIVMLACSGSFFTFVDPFTALRFPAAGGKAHTNFADESVCLMAYNIWN
jgi:hypothetical protein